MGAMAVVLHQFLSSHFNEKVRWALDWKGVAHRRESHLPGLHAAPLRRLSGQTQTPVLVLDGEVIAGSARILDALERRFPARPLFPHGAARERALQIQQRFDREVGPAVRTAIFSALLEEPAYLARLFAHAWPLPARLAYRGLLPLARGRIARANGVTDTEAIARALATSERALDWIAAEVGATGQLAGDAFSVADLTCAALLAPLARTPHPDMHKPEPIPPRVATLLARFAEHPGMRWVVEQYRRHRPPQAASR
jgi:glutathione S-transferase